MSHSSLRYLVPAVVLAAILAYCLFQAISISVTQAQEQRSFDELRQTASASAGAGGAEEPAAIANPGLQELREQNADFVGWLRIEGTIVDYPVMKSPESDPEYYLWRGFDGEESSSGCLFIGAGCDADSDVFVIYGHNMSNDTMLGTLDDFADYAFANEHQTIGFATPTENRRYRVFAAFQSKVYAEGEEGFRYYEEVGSADEEAYGRIVQAMRDISLIDIKNAPTWPAQILLLSTCSYHTDDGRFVVAAYREDA